MGICYETPNSRKKSDAIIYKTYEGEKSKTGYRIIWAYSSAKELRDKRRRENKIAKERGRNKFAILSVEAPA